MISVLPSSISSLNVLIGTFNEYSKSVKIELNRTALNYIAHIYGQIIKKSVLSKIRIGYNNIFRKLVRAQCSRNTMYIISKLLLD